MEKWRAKRVSLPISLFLRRDSDGNIWDATAEQRNEGDNADLKMMLSSQCRHRSFKINLELEGFAQARFPRNERPDCTYGGL